MFYDMHNMLVESLRSPQDESLVDTLRRGFESLELPKLFDTWPPSTQWLCGGYFAEWVIFSQHLQI